LKHGAMLYVMDNVDAMACRYAMARTT